MNTLYPPNWGQLFVLATKMYLGLVAYAATIPVTMVTAAQMLTSSTAFKNAGDIFNAARTTANNASINARPAQNALYEWLLTARAVIARRLGSRWSPQWAAAGFVAPSTQVPNTVAARIALGRSLATYLTDNPGFERPDMEVTAEKAIEVTDAAANAQTAVSTAEQALKAAGYARPAAKTDLLMYMNRVVDNLDNMLASNDPRWLAFGLPLPSTPKTPSAPTGLYGTVVSSDILLGCDPAPLATRYRFRGRIVGIEPDYRLLASAVDPMAMLKSVAVGVTLELIVQAVNGSAQSVASDPILVTMPGVEAKAQPVTEAELAPLAAIVPNGNGNGNGSLAVSRVS
jgi:hypothetical protein